MRSRASPSNANANSNESSSAATSRRRSTAATSCASNRLVRVGSLGTTQSTAIAAEPIALLASR
jgi:hypothetical protein